MSDPGPETSQKLSIRGKKACLNCRIRKVKCVLEDNSPPCKNCRLDGAVCNFIESKRGKRGRRARTHHKVKDFVNEQPIKRRVIGPNPKSTLVEWRPPEIKHTEDWLVNSESVPVPVQVVDCVIPEQFSQDFTQFQQDLDEDASNHQYDSGESGAEISSTSSRWRTPPILPEFMHRQLSYAPLIQHYTNTNTHTHINDPLATLEMELETDHEPHKGHGSSTTTIMATPMMAVPPTAATKSVSDSTTTPKSSRGLSALNNDLLHSLGSEDFRFLVRKGAMKIPDRQAMTQLIRAYIMYVHPWLPGLDLRFLSMCVSDCDTGADESQQPPSPTPCRISILLLQAVLFAGASACDWSVLASLGYSSRREARRAMYERVRLLYNFDVEQDRVVVLQAVLLMSIWSETADDEKGGWHWLGVAQSIALGLGLHRNPRDESTSLDTRRLRRRLWWSLYIRDRMFVLAMSRPARLRDEDFDTAPLTMDDFDLGESSPGTKADAAVSNLMSACGVCLQDQIEAYKTTVMLAELSTFISEVVSLQFSAVSSASHKHQSQSAAKTNTPLLLPWPRGPHGLGPQVWALDQRLQDWYRRNDLGDVGNERSCGGTRSTSSPASKSGSPSFEDGGLPPNVTVLRGYIRMTFYSVSAALHRPQLQYGQQEKIPSNANGSTSTQFQKAQSNRSKYKVQAACDEIALVTHQLEMSGIICFGPMAIIMYQIPTVLFFLSQINDTDDSGARQDATEKICHCLQGLESMRSVYIGAEIAASIICHGMQKAQASVIRGKNATFQGITHKGASYIIPTATEPDNSRQHNAPDMSMPPTLSSGSDVESGVCDLSTSLLGTSLLEGDPFWDLSWYYNDDAAMNPSFYASTSDEWSKQYCSLKP
ncbi:hypothetical protein PV10_04639 [Exophiala mesophila]|uniref:Zn(2)-C6 fungal-type domain-containing protein n=1 Tax=Exophiala mesophila TaxID=212818 RepID=A0A0D1XYX1_EXOME|nr:uncharacterized protein PV10_04639 [Exophiala mesophila]KIV93426.1 hypothetical protein PV10_04639 [Exophiala mesophila]